MMTTAMTSDRHSGGFLPAGSRVGIIAGSGSLPVNVAQSLERGGFNPYVVIIEGEVDRVSDLTVYEHVTLPIEAAAVAFDRLKSAGVTHAILAGGVVRRPRISSLKWTPSILKALPKFALHLALGDDGLLRSVMRHIETLGIKIVGAHEVVPDLLAKSGSMTRLKPNVNDERDIRAALQAAQAIGKLDIGQAAISVGGRVVALEGIEGTDGLLERMIALRSHGRLAGRDGGVLVKCSKPTQDIRADLPAIGVRTIKDVKKAGLRGIAVETNRAFVLDYSETITAADEEGVFLIGLDL